MENQPSEWFPSFGRNRLFLIVFSCPLLLIFLNACNNSDEGKADLVEGAENLGSGFDVFGNYANAKDVKGIILDVTKLNADGLIETKTLENSIFTTTSGTSIEQYSSSMSASASLSGNYMYFSGAITTNFHEDRYKYESYSFATVSSMIQKTQLRLPVDMSADDLKPYLTATAKSKLNDASVSSDYIFSTYGTHCLTGVILGGRLDYSVSAETSDLTSGKSIGVYAEASFSKGGVSISGNASYVNENEYARFMSSCKKKLFVYGGQSEFGQEIINADDYTAWINSIDSKPVFCNFTQHGLVPVWEFCTDPSRKTELMAAYEKWAAKRKIVVEPPQPRKCILDVKILFGHEAADPWTSPNGRVYNRLFADLNAAASGSYIWLYYLLGDENDATFTPVAEIRTINTTDNETFPSGETWEQIDGNLNKGAGGDNIFIAIKRMVNANDSLLTGLRVDHVMYNSHVYSSFTSAQNQWYPVTEGSNGIIKQNLNEGCNKDDEKLIYLNFTYDKLVFTK